MSGLRPPAGDRPLNVLIVEDHPIVRMGLVQLIGQQPNLRVCGEVDSVAGALRWLDEQTADVAVVDVSLTDGSGLDLIRQIKQRHLPTRALVVSSHDPAHYAQVAIDAGAMGYVNKHEATDYIVQAIESIACGQIYLSPRAAPHGSPRPL